MSLLLLISGTAFSQSKTPVISGSWKAISKIEIETLGGKVTDEDKEIYKPGEKSYTFTSNTVTISQGFGKHVEKLPIKLSANQLFIGKPEKNKQPYLISNNAGKLVLKKTERKIKKGSLKTETETLILEK